MQGILHLIGLSLEINIKGTKFIFCFITFCTNWIILPEAGTTDFLKGNMNYLDDKIMGRFGFLLYTFSVLKKERNVILKHTENMSPHILGNSGYLGVHYTWCGATDTLD